MCGLELCLVHRPASLIKAKGNGSQNVRRRKTNEPPINAEMKHNDTPKARYSPPERERTLAALRASERIKVSDCAHVATSFPGFADLALQTGLRLEVADE